MMSKDRVRFYLADNEENKTAAINAATLAFGFKHLEACRLFNSDTAIICRPSQFARYLIFRSTRVKNNAYQQLKATLIPAGLAPDYVDVSTAPAPSVDIYLD